jgi:hypothetical protein
MHLDDADLDDDLDVDDLAYLELSTDEEAAESAAEQRVPMASFETQRRDEVARRLMAAKRRAEADDLAAAHQSACQSAYLRNLVATGRWPREDRERVEAERRLQVERVRAAELARVPEHQYPCPPTTPILASQKMPNAAAAASAIASRQANMAAPAIPARAALALNSNR